MMRRLGLTILLTVTPSSLFGQLGTPAVLGVEARPPIPTVEIGDADKAEVNPAEMVGSNAGVGAGLSGAIRVLVASTGEPLALEQLEAFAPGWERGHRWTLIGAAPGTPASPPAGPRVLGVAASELLPSTEHSEYSAAVTHTGPVRTPDRPGTWQLESASGEGLTVLAVVPANRVHSGHLNGYHIGFYPTEGSGRADAYAPPTAFVEVTLENRDLRVSEHLILGQFLTKDQFDVWPKYVALDLRLIDKLELVIQELHTMGVRADRIHVMSGFRTPQYNGPGGDGRAALSRHMWGDAADVWIDGTGDGQMDDLNGDGRVDMDDAAIILRAVDRVERRYPDLVGGAGLYPPAPGRGPYIHIDARGYHSRW